MRKHSMFARLALGGLGVFAAWGVGVGVVDDLGETVDGAAIWVDVLGDVVVASPGSDGFAGDGFAGCCGDVGGEVGSCAVAGCEEVGGYGGEFVGAVPPVDLCRQIVVLLRKEFSEVFRRGEVGGDLVGVAVDVGTYD